MKITAARTVVVGNSWKNWVFVRLETDEGLAGWGEGTGGLQTMPMVASIREMEPLYLGLDPRDVTDVWRRLHSRCPSDPAGQWRSTRWRRPGTPTRTRTSCGCSRPVGSGAKGTPQQEAARAAVNEEAR